MCFRFSIKVETFVADMKIIPVFECFPYAMLLYHAKNVFSFISMHAYASNAKPMPDWIHRILWPWYAHTDLVCAIYETRTFVNANACKHLIRTTVEIAFDFTRYHRLYNVWNWIWKAIINHMRIQYIGHTHRIESKVRVVFTCYE